MLITKYLELVHSFIQFFLINQLYLFYFSIYTNIKELSRFNAS